MGPIPDFRAWLTQHALAHLNKKPQSFVAKYEGGERRLDVVEFITIAGALGVDPLKLLADFVAGGKDKSARPEKPPAKRNSCIRRPYQKARS